MKSRRSIGVEEEAYVFDVRLSQSLRNFFGCLVILFPRLTFSTMFSLFFSVLFDLDSMSVVLDRCAA